MTHVERIKPIPKLNLKLQSQGQNYVIQVMPTFLLKKS